MMPATFHDLNELYYFTMVVEHQGFAAAARALGVSKSMLSKRIARLEERLQTRLIQRTTRHFLVTETGRRFYQHCNAMLVEAQAAHEAVAAEHEEPSGNLRVSCPVLLAQTFIAPLLPVFLNANPRINLQLVVSDRRVQVIPEGFDVSLRVRSDMGEDGELALRQFGIMTRPLVASPAYLDRHGRPDNLTQLQQLHTMSNQQDNPHQYWDLVNKQGDMQRVELTPRLVSSELNVLLAAAIQGNGVALLPTSLCGDALLAGQLETVLGQWYGAPAMVHAVFPSRRGMLPAVRAWIDFLALQLPPRLQALDVWEP